MQKRPATENKIVSLAAAISLRANWKTQNESVVFTNGCFDILHLGHIDYLEKSSQKGDHLIVAVNTDRSVSALKGPSRPVNHAYARARLIAALEFVSMVIIFDEDTPLDLIKQLLPDILVKGNDYSIATIVGSKEVLENGGQVETIELVPNFSTTGIIEKLKN
ncbi:D-glycero-beta-D-manno-heptose 1-phosphate adenylyltransferase [Aquirufa sp. ROCK2-A2]